MFERKNYLDKSRNDVPREKITLTRQGLFQILAPRKRRFVLRRRSKPGEKKFLLFSFDESESNPHLKSFSLLASDERESALKCFWGGILVFGQRHQACISLVSGLILVCSSGQDVFFCGQPFVLQYSCGNNSSFFVEI